MFARPRRTVDTTKDTQFTDAWFVLAALLTIVGLILGNAFLTAAAAVILVVTAVAWGWSRLGFFGLTYTRTLNETRVFRGETVTLELAVRNQKFLPVNWLVVRDIFPSDLPVSGRELVVNPATNKAEYVTFWMPGPFQRTVRRFELACNVRGFHGYGPVTMTTGDGFGFFNRTRQVDDQLRLIVYPHLYSAAELNLPTKNPFGNVGVRGQLYEDPMRTIGVREWREEDTPRRIHWKATARQQQLLSRVYEPSEEQQVLLCLNVATLERHWHGYFPELQERTIAVAGSLAALAVEQRLAVGLIANGALPGSDQPLRLLPGRSPAQLVRILELLAAVTPFATDPIERMLLNEAPRLPWGSTLVVVTAIAHEALLASLLDLAQVGRRMVLVTLAQEPPRQLLEGVTVYHLPHLVDDVVAPALVQEGRLGQVRGSEAFAHTRGSAES
jgi:uncharacterized protein (DUF58 family)